MLDFFLPWFFAMIHTPVYRYDIRPEFVLQAKHLESFTKNIIKNSNEQKSYHFLGLDNTFIFQRHAG